MFFWRRVTCIASAAILALVAFTPSTHVVCPGDVNGDQQLDILDIQLVAAALTNETASTLTADLNRDGRIDILDFQLLIAETSAPESADNTSSPEEPPAVLQEASSLIRLRPAALEVAVAAPGAVGTADAVGLFQLAALPTPPPKLLRGRCGYSPHSPPQKG